MNAQETAKEYLAALKEKEQLENTLSDLNARLSGISTALYEQMVEEAIGSIEIEGIKFEPKIEQDFSLAGKFKGKKWDEIGVWFDWLKQIGEGALIKMKESVAANTRKKFLKDWVEENKPLPEFVEEKFFNTVKFNKSAVKRLVGGNDVGEESEGQD